MQSQPSWHVASYPRSGNHLVRAILKAYTNRPTEGCLGARFDPPIHQRKANRANLIRINSDDPIGYKAHFLREIHARDRMEGGPLGLILVTRDPAAAIASQVTRILTEGRILPWVSSRRKRIIIQDQIDIYLSLVFRYAAQTHAPRIHVRYEDLVSRDTAEPSARDFLARLGATLQGPSLADVSALAKDSQSSLGSKATDLKQEIQTEVRERLTYDEVLSYLR